MKNVNLFLLPVLFCTAFDPHLTETFNTWKLPSLRSQILFVSHNLPSLWAFQLVRWRFEIASFQRERPQHWADHPISRYQRWNKQHELSWLAVFDRHLGLYPGIFCNKKITGKTSFLQNVHRRHKNYFTYA